MTNQDDSAERSLRQRHARTALRMLTEMRGASDTQAFRDADLELQIGEWADDPISQGSIKSLLRRLSEAESRGSTQAISEEASRYVTEG